MSQCHSITALIFTFTCAVAVQLFSVDAADDKCTCSAIAAAATACPRWPYQEGWVWHLACPHTRSLLQLQSPYTRVSAAPILVSVECTVSQHLIMDSVSIPGISCPPFACNIIRQPSNSLKEIATHLNMRAIHASALIISCRIDC